jgi:hypothetical protein
VTYFSDENPKLIQLASHINIAKFCAENFGRCQRNLKIRSTCQTQTTQTSRLEPLRNGHSTGVTPFGTPIMANILFSTQVYTFTPWLRFRPPGFRLTLVARLIDPAELEKLAKEKLSLAGW